jgi:transcriptional regulator with XRE-family HTH domain
VAEPPVTFAALLRKRRAEAWLTQEELAEASGVRPRLISDLERGVTVTPQREIVRRLAHALNLTGLERTQFEAAARGLPVPAAAEAADTKVAAATLTLVRDIASGTGRPQELSRSANLAGHAFISYAREDAHRVDQLQRALEAAGITVWRDTADLWPGEDWRANIRRAITDDALVFIACFSRTSLGRIKSYQNEELILAIEQLRQRRPEDPWLIPVRFDECDIPDRDIGDGRTLRSIQWADLFGDRGEENTTRLITTVLRILGRPALKDNRGEMRSLAQLPSLRRRTSQTAMPMGQLGDAESAEPRGPLFYLSYSLQAGRESEVRGTPIRRIGKFFEDLSENVAQLSGLPAGQDPGYMARSFPDGRGWPAELLAGLGTCQVFVPLLSRPYFSSTQCGMEWYAFTQRRVVSRTSGRRGGQAAIIPVIWAPARESDMPAAVRSIQWFSPNSQPDADLGNTYQRNGVAGLLQMRMDAAYGAVVWQLAQRIVEIADNLYVESVSLSQDNLRDVFWRP